MITDPRTGMRSIGAARESFAAVAVICMLFATVLRCLDGRSGAVAGAIVTLMGLAVLSRYRVSWDEDGISYQTPFSVRRRMWTEFSEYRMEPEMRDKGAMRMPDAGRGGISRTVLWRLRLRGRDTDLDIALGIYSLQDIRHLTDRVSTEVPLAETQSALV